MRIVIAMIAFVGLPGMSGLAGAAQISSPSIFGGSTQNLAQCVILNGGTTSLTAAVQILDESGNAVKTSNCGTMAPNDFCSAATGISFGGSYSCIATAGSVANLRGAMVIKEPVSDGFGGTNERPFRSAPLR
jgi:hypothetical protein